jgi:hypothetical protein
MYEDRLSRETRVERVIVSAQPVQRCLDREGLVLDDGVWRPARRLVSGGGWPTIGTLSRATKAARPSDEDR